MYAIEKFEKIEPMEGFTVFCERTTPGQQPNEPGTKRKFPIAWFGLELHAKGYVEMCERLATKRVDRDKGTLFTVEAGAPEFLP